jgi:uncharacterized protein with ATP-grasp and redox domains
MPNYPIDDIRLEELEKKYYRRVRVVGGKPRISDITMPENLTSCY